jgi:hypothetical protein
MGTTIVLSLFLLTISAVVPGSNALRVTAAAVDPPTALPQLATALDLKFQPGLDYDTDGCYNVPAIDADGNVSQGLPHDYVGAAQDCRDPSDLANSNAYSRQRCNNGWCIYLYDYYFEKDVAVQYVIDAGGHRHDWEHVAVWVQDDIVKYVAASQHGKWAVRSASDVLFDDTHPRMVYNKDGGSTHNFRFADSGEEPENSDGTWVRSPLISYNGFPTSQLRDDILFTWDFGSATIAIKDDQFPNNINGALPSVDGAPAFIFDANVDDGSPGDPRALNKLPNVTQPYWKGRFNTTRM